MPHTHTHTIAQVTLRRNKLSKRHASPPVEGLRPGNGGIVGSEVSDSASGEGDSLFQYGSGGTTCVWKIVPYSMNSKALNMSYEF